MLRIEPTRHIEMKAFFWQASAGLGLWLVLGAAAEALDPSVQYFQYQYIEVPEKAELSRGTHAMVQDTQGFLWLGTERGLVRFDGLETETFRALDHPGLVSNHISNLWVTRAGDLLIATEQGMSRYDGVQFESVVGGNKWSAFIHAMAQDDAGAIWLGSARGLWRWHDNTLHAAHEDRIGAVTALLQSDGQLYVGGEGFVFRIFDDTVQAIPLPEPWSTATVSDLTRHRGIIWGATNRGLFSLEQDQITPAPNEQLKDIAADRLLSDRDGNLWFYGRSTLGRVRPDDSVELPDIVDQTFGIEAQFTDLLEDTEGRLWTSSEMWPLNALADAPLRRISFSEGLLAAAVQAIVVDETDGVLIITPVGINRMSDQGLEVVLETDLFGHYPARSATLDPNQRLWIGTSKGLYVLSMTDRTLEKVDLIDPVAVNALASDPSDPDVVWIGTDLGLQKWDSGEVSSLPAVAGVAVEALFFDRRQTLWVGTETGLISVGEDTLTLHTDESPGTMDAIVSIAQLGNGQIIAATRNHGLIVSSDDGWRAYSERTGLPPASIIDIELRDDDVWLISTAGIFRFDAAQIYADRSELSVEAIVSLGNHRATYVDLCCSGDNSYAAVQSNGVLVTATGDGVITLDMTRPNSITTAPAPYIKTVMVDGQSAEVDVTETLVAPETTKQIKITYSALSLGDDGRTEFRYRLRGLNDAWVDMGASRLVHLTNLPPGDFTFELQASLAPSIWSNDEVHLAIRRTPAITETLLFRALAWCGSIGFVLALFWLRTRVARYRHRRLEGQIRDRTEQLRAVNDQLEQRNDHLRQACETDTLTGLLNRRFFDSRKTTEEFDASLRDEGVLIMVDIDHFKRINDTWGHAAGDAVLRQFADVLRAATRESDVVARWGGEEFLLLCRCQSAHAPDLLERMLNAVRAHAFVLDDGENIRVHSSLGAIQYPLWPGQNLTYRLGMLLELADAALYRVKSCGRDGWALLAGDESPKSAIEIKRVGPLLSSLIEQNSLTWRSSRPGIKPDNALDPTGT